MAQYWLQIVAHFALQFNTSHIDIGRGVLSRVVNGHSAVTADLDLRLSEALGTSAGHWLALQMQRDLWNAKLAAKKRKRIKPMIHREMKVA